MVAKLSKKAEMEGEKWFIEMMTLIQKGNDDEFSNRLCECKHMYFEEHEILGCIRQLTDGASPCSGEFNREIVSNIIVSNEKPPLFTISTTKGNVRFYRLSDGFKFINDGKSTVLRQGLCHESAYELFAYGYMDLQEYSEQKYYCSGIQRYSVNESFPKITRKNIPAQIISLHYELNLPSLKDWKKE